MSQLQTKSYPTIGGAIHLIVLYIFIQTIVDFPLALFDYYNGTDYLYNPIKKILLGPGSTLFIFYYAWRRAGVPLGSLFPSGWFNFLILFPLLSFLWASHILIDEVNFAIDKILPAPSWFWEMFNKIFESDFGIYGAILKVVILAPIVEELIFRGVIMHGLMRNYKGVTAVLVSALMFALFHLNPWQLPATFVLGLLLGFLMLRTRNIYLCIIGHAFNNGLVLFSVQYWDVLQKTAFYQSGKSIQLLTGFVVMVLSLFLIVMLSRSNRLKTN